MFCAVYRFEVRKDMEGQFTLAWRKLTELIYRHKGSLGSRLHRGSDGVFVAYAQWPTRKLWESPGGLPVEADAVREQMKAACLSIEALHELDVVDDLLRGEPWEDG